MESRIKEVKIIKRSEYEALSRWADDGGPVIEEDYLIVEDDEEIQEMNKADLGPQQPSQRQSM